MFYQTVITSVLFYAVVYWGGSIKRRDTTRLDKLVRKAGSVVGAELDTLTSVAEKRILGKILSILDNVQHPLHQTFSRQRSSFSDRLLFLVCCSALQTDRGIHLSLGLYGFTNLPCEEDLNWTVANGLSRWTRIGYFFCTLFILFIFVFYVYTFYACFVVCFNVSTGYLNFPSGINKVSIIIIII